MRIVALGERCSSAGQWLSSRKLNLGKIGPDRKSELKAGDCVGLARHGELVENGSIAEDQLVDDDLEAISIELHDGD